MKIRIVTPAPRGSHTGNRVTARRWARLLHGLGHRVEVQSRVAARDCDLQIAIHARKSHAAVLSFHERHPDRPLVVALAGTDLYSDLRGSPEARESLRLATRIVVLQPEATRAVPRWARSKARVIVQSAVPALRGRRRAPGFRVCVLAHLRDVKDPLLTARAARLLPAGSRVRVVHAGAALDPALERLARAEERANPRYRWVGDLPRGRALRLLASSRLLSLTSRLEGGANAVSEAVACSVPVVSTRIAGSIGILGRDYPGFFRVGDERGLVKLLERAERDPVFYRTLRSRCVELRPLVSPERERQSWRRLLEEIQREREASGTASGPPAASARPLRPRSPGPGSAGRRSLGSRARGSASAVR